MVRKKQVSKTENKADLLKKIKVLSKFEYLLRQQIHSQELNA